jgi:hypothetical protein
LGSYFSSCSSSFSPSSYFSFYSYFNFLLHLRLSLKRVRIDHYPAVLDSLFWVITKVFVKIKIVFVTSDYLYPDGQGAGAAVP